MRRIIIIPLLVLCSASVADAEVYTWTDARGVVTFTDNPERIPSRYSGRARQGEDNIIRIPKVQKVHSRQKETGKHRRNRPHAAIPKNRVRSVAAALAQQKSAELEMKPEIKGHLGGDQKDPAPPSMKQPKAETSGDQPTPTAPGMKQPKPAAPDEQPKETPAGMKQPKAEPLGEQPKPTPLGMEQPVPKR